ncbi:MAG: hypothetical protein JW759_03485 [Candidatus Coatesbacteria bacterium]|nr:hypothetical protein [Candidatus Coatesbacteria bacterium]
MKRTSFGLILTLVIVCVGCASAPKEKATSAAPDTGSKLRLVELKFPEKSGWDLKSGFLMFITNPEWVLLDGSSYELGQKPEHFLETYCHTEATEGVVRFRLPEELSDEAWAKLSLGLHYDKPSKRPRSLWDAWFSPDYHLPPGINQELLSLSFESQEVTLEPHLRVGEESLDVFVGRLNGVFTGADLSLDGLSVPDRPTFAGFHLTSFEPVKSLDAELRSVPVFRQMQETSGLFAVSVGLDLETSQKRHDNTYSATFVIGDDESRIGEDGSLTATMAVDIVPIELLAPEGKEDAFLDIWATAPFKYYSNTTQIMSCNVRVSGSQPGRVYLQRGVAFRVQVFDVKWKLLRPIIVPVERPEKIVLDLSRENYAGFESPRVEKKSNNRPSGGY